MKVEFLGIYLGDCESIDSSCDDGGTQWEGWIDFVDFIPSAEFLKAYPELQNKKYEEFTIYIGSVDYPPPQHITMYVTFRGRVYYSDEIIHGEFDIKNFIGEKNNA